MYKLLFWWRLFYYSYLRQYYMSFEEFWFRMKSIHQSSFPKIEDEYEPHDYDNDPWQLQ